MRATKRKREKDVPAILLSRTKGEKVVYAVFFLLFCLYAVSMIFPILMLLKNSFMEAIEYDLMLSPFDMPAEWMFENYSTAFELVKSNGKDLVNMFAYSILWCAVRIVGVTLMSSFTGYVMSKYKFKGHGVIYTIIIFSLTIPIVGTTGSTFVLADSLGIYNTWFYVILTSLNGFTMYFLIMYGYFSGISWSYAEAVFIDGGGHFTAFFKVMLPQAFAPMLTVAIMIFISEWNQYETNMLYMPSFPTVSAGLYKAKGLTELELNRPAYFAGLILATLPTITIFSIFSDMIMKNFSVGGLKG